MKYLGLLGAIGAALLAAAPAGPVVAAMADFYEDKRVKIIVGGPPGGGVDGYGPAPGRHIFRHIPVQAAVPEIRRVTWLKKPEVHWEPHFSSRPSR